MNKYPLVHGVSILLLAAVVLSLMKAFDPAQNTGGVGFVLPVCLLTLGVFLYWAWRKSLARTKDTALVWIHLWSMLIGLAMFVYVLIPRTDSRTVDALAGSLGWIFLGFVLIMLSIVFLLVIIVRIGSGKDQGN